MIKKTLAKVAWWIACMASFGVFVGGITAGPSSFWDYVWLWVGFLVMVSAADQLDLFWWRTRANCCSSEHPEGPFPYVSGYKENWRDRAVASTLNWLLNRFATTGYLNFITTLMTLGRAEFEKRLEADPDGSRDD